MKNLPSNECITWITGDNDLVHLRRLSLIFDRVHYIAPQIVTLTGDALNNPERAIRTEEGIAIVDFNYFRDTERIWEGIPDSFPHLTRDLEVFTQAGITSQLQLDEIEESGSFAFARNMLVSQAMNDPALLTLVSDMGGTQEYKIYTINVTLDDDGKDLKLHAFQSPTVLDDVWEISTLLNAAHRLDFASIEQAPRRQRVMRYYSEQYQSYMSSGSASSSGSEVLLDMNPKYGDALGEVTFRVASSVVSSDLLSEKSAEEIVKYRNSMDTARRRFISSDLTELSDLVRENPWNSGTELEVKKYIRGKFVGDMVSYDNASREVWEKFYGSIPTHIAEITAKSALGGSAGGFVGSIAAIHAWPLLLAGGLVGAVTQGPKVVRDLSDAILESRKLKRTPISYLANFR